jgi:hypothetical protein
MKKDPVSMPVLITTAIAVSSPQTLLTDSKVRLELTVESIRRWRFTRGISGVVVCDGSGYDLSPHIDAGSPKEAGHKCEVLTFINDTAGVRTKGKGYGEGEIVMYALRHSEMLNKSPSFAKCTGKLWVENYIECARGFNGLAAFDFGGKFKPKKIETRFYMVNKEFFLSSLGGLHNKVNDADGYYLEDAFKEGLKTLRFSDFIMYPTPRIRGVSGSTGISYRPDRFKSALRDMKALFVRSIGGHL